MGMEEQFAGCTASQPRLYGRAAVLFLVVKRYLDKTFLSGSPLLIEATYSSAGTI